MKKFLTGAAGVMLLFGLGVLLYPVANRYLQEGENKKQIHYFQQEITEKGADNKTEELREAMDRYNALIYKEHQRDLKDAFDQQEKTLDFSGLPFENENMIGYLTIEAMDLKIPLYVDATKENLSRAAAVILQTSMPVGGMNTNCVIAAHRGYRGQAMFRDIEILKEGDLVEITNPWETLRYRVIKCIVIQPDDLEAVRIQEGKDMVTLVTCHPYRHNDQRYVVYCEREGAAGVEIPFDGVSYVSSRGAIYQEKVLRFLGIVFFILIVAIFTLRGIVRIVKENDLGYNKRV